MTTPLSMAIVLFLLNTLTFAGEDLYPYAQYIPGVHIQQTHKNVLLSEARPYFRVGAPKPKDDQDFTSKLARALGLAPNPGSEPIHFNQEDFVKQSEASFFIEAYSPELNESFAITVPNLKGTYQGHHHTYKIPSEDSFLYQHSVHDVAQAFANLPASTRSLLTKPIDLHFKRNPQDFIYQKLFARPTFRAYQSALIYPHGVVGIFPQPELPPKEMMTDTMAHEAGHVWSFKCFSVDGNSEGWRNWREAIKEDGNQVTHYGASSFLEDAAEMALIYASVTAKADQELIIYFKEKFPHRWRILEETYPDC